MKGIELDIYSDVEKPDLFSVITSNLKINEEKSGLHKCCSKIIFNEKLYKKFLTKKNPLFFLYNNDFLIGNENINLDILQRELYLVENTILAAKPRQEYAFLFHDKTKGNLRFRNNKLVFTSNKDRIPFAISFHLAHLRNDYSTNLVSLGEIVLNAYHLEKRWCEISFAKDYKV